MAPHPEPDFFSFSQRQDTRTTAIHPRDWLTTAVSRLKEVLRLHSHGMSQHQIARSCSVSQSTVHDYISAAQTAGVKWPLPEDWSDRQIGEALFPQRPAPEVWRK